MAFRFTIAKKIGTGFGVLLFFLVIVFYTTYTTLNASIDINDKITDVNSPSVSSLEELKLLTVRSKMLIFNWVYIQSQSDHPDKQKLTRLIDRKYPYLIKKVEKLSVNWDKADQDRIKVVFEKLAELFEMHKEIIMLLPDWDSYDDSQNKFMATYYIGDDGDVYIKTSEILFELDDLISNQKFHTGNATEVMQSSFSDLKWLTRWLGIALVIFGVLVAFYTTRSIVRPVHKLKMILLSLSKGVFPKKSIKAKSDEIGEMTNALNRVISGLDSTKEFAIAVGAGRFDTEYEPLSEEDSLGKTLIKMRDDLAENERVLEQKVIERTAEVVEKQKEVELQNEKISELYEEVTDSIKYAKGLQEAILPPTEFVEKSMPDSFILYKPKDIVSGDFYWVEEKNDKVYFAAVDCTGHGVPGAFMSIVGYNALNEALRTNDDPGSILDGLNRGISKTLHNNAMGSTTKDGMDLALCCYDKKTKELQYAGAYNPLYLIRDGEVNQLKADKFAIGGYFDDPSKKYTNHVIQLQEEDYIYIFSDGYADQFGGPKGKKFMYKRFRDHLLTLKGREMNDQKLYLDNTLEDWKGPLEQIDDILVIGIHVS
ncbi:MAG: SpoIIE family protein phosphatase [Vicingaceae bacterium]|nr:SpoIIE family protein phosphatase [Vicingaceae bacterium]